MYITYYVRVLWLINEHNVCIFRIYVEKQLCVLLMAHKWSMNDTNYSNKTLNVYQYNLVYSGNVKLNIGTI